VKFTGQDHRNLWLVRHGESTWNVQGLVQGHADDAVLTALGQRQAAELGAHFTDASIAAIYSSDLLRARQTADGMAANLGLPVWVDARLRERSFGDVEGQAVAALTPALTGIDGETVIDADAHPSGGESLNDVYRRTEQFVAMLEATASAGDIVVVAHGGSLRTIRAYCSGLTASDMPWDTVGNGSVWCIPLPTDPSHVPHQPTHAYEGVR
jgi:probable phosphoglycerate mutase